MEDGGVRIAVHGRERTAGFVVDTMAVNVQWFRSTLTTEAQCVLIPTSPAEVQVATASMLAKDAVLLTEPSPAILPDRHRAFVTAEPLHDLPPDYSQNVAIDVCSLPARERRSVQWSAVLVVIVYSAFNSHFCQTRVVGQLCQCRKGLCSTAPSEISLSSFSRHISLLLVSECAHCRTPFTPLRSPTCHDRSPQRHAT